MNGTQVILWVLVAVAAVAIEMFTLAIIALYFGIGATVAAITAGVGGSFETQLLVFALTSLLLLFLTRPFIARRVLHPAVMSNASTIVGKRGIVTIRVDNDENTGQVRIGTEYWTARTPGDHYDPIELDTKVRVIEVHGVTAHVVPLHREHVEADDESVDPSAGPLVPEPEAG